jgi:hypothetical protein
VKHEAEPDTSRCVPPDPCFRVGPLSTVRVGKTGGCYRPNGLAVPTPAYCWEAQEKDPRE